MIQILRAVFMFQCEVSYLKLTDYNVVHNPLWPYGFHVKLISFILNFDLYRQEVFCTGKASANTVFKNPLQ